MELDEIFRVDGAQTQWLNVQHVIHVDGLRWAISIRDKMGEETPSVSCFFIHFVCKITQEVMDGALLTD